MIKSIAELAELNIANDKNEPTRREHKGSKILKSIIDFTIISKELQLGDHKIVMGSLIYSDHLPIYFEINKDMGSIKSRTIG